MTDPRPAYQQLPTHPDGTRNSWGFYGSDDQLGAANELTPERIAAAASLIRTGDRFSLNLDVDQPAPPFFGRQPVAHRVDKLAPSVFDDRIDGYYPQGSSQWDALSHFCHSEGFYNRAQEADIRAGVNCVNTVAEKGFAGRGVLLDVAAWAAATGDGIDPASAYAVDSEIVRSVLDHQGTDLRPGDILCVRTGWVGWFLGLPEEEQAKVAEGSLDYMSFSMPGMSSDPGLAELLWDNAAAAVCIDAAAGEVLPSPPPDETFHARVMASLGIHIGELFNFDDLAAACSADGRFDFFFASAPLSIPKGIGSPSNALAIR